MYRNYVYEFLKDMNNQKNYAKIYKVNKEYNNQMNIIIKINWDKI